MSYANKEVLKNLAETNLRGLTISDIVYQILDLKYDEPTFVRPSECSSEEWTEDHKYFNECRTNALLGELDRREHINKTYVVNPERQVIQTIKESTRIEDVIEWYCEVTYEKGEQWKFRCKVHGNDTSPSGVIYLTEGKWHCFGCNKGGDIFDAVCHFERVELKEAIKKLATNLGIELRPLRKQNPIVYSHEV